MIPLVFIILSLRWNSSTFCTKSRVCYRWVISSLATIQHKCSSVSDKPLVNLPRTQSSHNVIGFLLASQYNLFHSIQFTVAFWRTWILYVVDGVLTGWEARLDEFFPNDLKVALAILRKRTNQFFLSSSSQLFASVAPILLVETRSDANEDEADDEDLSGKVSFPKRWTMLPNTKLSLVRISGRCKRKF